MTTINNYTPMNRPRKYKLTTEIHLFPVIAKQVNYAMSVLLSPGDELLEVAKDLFQSTGWVFKLLPSDIAEMLAAGSMVDTSPSMPAPAPLVGLTQYSDDMSGEDICADA